jgi:ApbE superfamily uncharacterized protein (UPF0280 family)
MPLRSRKAHHFDVPVQDLVLRVTGPEELYDQVRASGLGFWEQVQSYSVRNRLFQTSKAPLYVTEDSPAIVREMAEVSRMAGVGPMFTFQGALLDHVGRELARTQPEVVVATNGGYFVVARRRARLGVHPGLTEGQEELAVVVKPELGPHGIYTTAGRTYLPADTSGGLVVVAGSCILADAVATAALAVLARPRSFGQALRYLQGFDGVFGALLLQGERIGVAGSLELAA